MCASLGWSLIDLGFSKMEGFIESIYRDRERDRDRERQTETGRERGRETHRKIHTETQRHREAENKDKLDRYHQRNFENSKLMRNSGRVFLEKYIYICIRFLMYETLLWKLKVVSNILWRFFNI